MYKSALVALKPQGANEALTDMAIQLATRQGLQLSALSVIDTAVVQPAEAVPPGATVYKEHKDELLAEETLVAAQEQLDAFTSACSAAGVACTASLCEGTLHDQIPLAVQSCDMFLLGNGGEINSEQRADVARLDSILRHSARPCLLVPDSHADVQRVAVAYDGSAQAARTLHDFANSGLWAGCAVDIVSIAEDTDVAAGLAGRAAGYLSQHDFITQTHPLVAHRDVGLRIVSFVGESGADALVIGAYGKTRWHEFFFGTITRDVLRGVMVPIFMSH